MEMQAQQEARVRQIQAQMIKDQTQAEVAKEEAKHDMGLETEELKHKQAKDLSNQEFQQEIVLKAVDGGMRKNESKRVPTNQ